MFARLSVFPGDFSFEAAEKICDAAMDTLEALVDSSLLQPAGDGRFRMLEIVRQRAAEYLVDADGTEAVRRRHSILPGARRGAPAKPPRWGSEAGFATVEREHDNFRSAMVFVGTNGLNEASSGSARAIHRHWYMRGYLSEGRAGSRRLSLPAGASASGASASARRGSERCVARRGIFEAAARRTLRRRSSSSESR